MLAGIVSSSARFTGGTPWSRRTADHSRPAEPPCGDDRDGRSTGDDTRGRLPGAWGASVARAFQPSLHYGPREPATRASSRVRPGGELDPASGEEAPHDHRRLHRLRP